MPELIAALTLAFAPFTCGPMPTGYEQAGGVYWPAGHAIVIRTDLCQRLELVRKGARPRSEFTRHDFAEAIFIYAHETAHYDGIADERQADCVGLRRFNRVAAVLGLGPGWRRLLRSYAEPFVRC